jgi:hypothetical protein
MIRAPAREAEWRFSTPELRISVVAKHEEGSGRAFDAFSQRVKGKQF